MNDFVEMDLPAGTKASAGPSPGSTGIFAHPVNSQWPARYSAASVVEVNDDGTVDVTFPNDEDPTNPHGYGHVPVLLHHEDPPASGLWFIPNATEAA